jgi:hypothetical protein
MSSLSLSLPLRRLLCAALLVCSAAAMPPTPGFDAEWETETIRHEQQVLQEERSHRVRVVDERIEFSGQRLSEQTEDEQQTEDELPVFTEQPVAENGSASPSPDPSSVCVPIPDLLDPTQTAKIAVTQFEAAKDAHTHHNRILKMVTQYFNSHFTDIVRVNIEYEGEALSGKIGKYEITTHFNRYVGANLVSECRTIEYWVEDVNECELGLDKCHETSAVCVNTIGSYECQCRYADYFGVENSGSVSFTSTFMGKRQEPGSCGRMRDTAECCTSACSHDRTSACYERCKEDFKCSNNPCEFNKCHESAVCIPDHDLHTYNCQCNDGYQGNGFSCVKYTPPDHCASNQNSCVYPCQCVNRLTQGGYSCEAPNGLISVPNPFGAPLPADHTDNGGHRLDHNFCFSKHGMDLSLDGPNPITYRQGDTYEEHGLQVSDSQPENFVRKVQIDYSHPFGAYFRQPGHFEVMYTIQTPWLGADRNITKTRTVIVNDVDECTYTGDVASFHHQCSATARCVNTYGSYDCLCPAGYEGDARFPGTGCTDSRPPQLACAGKGCSIMNFKAVSCVGIMSEVREDIYLFIYLFIMFDLFSL